MRAHGSGRRGPEPITGRADARVRRTEPGVPPTQRPGPLFMRAQHRAPLAGLAQGPGSEDEIEKGRQKRKSALLSDADSIRISLVLSSAGVVSATR